MTLDRILENELINADSIYLYQDGEDWNAYEFSAYLLLISLPKTNTRRLPVAGAPDVIVARIPFSKILRYYAKWIVTIGDSYCRVRLPFTGRRFDFEKWKMHLTV